MNRLFRRRLLPLPLLGFLAALVVAGAHAQGEGGNRAGLVIRYGEDRVETYCVSFSEPEITGSELLERAGREVEVNAMGMGVTVCRLDDVGCPAGSCFCECRGSSCVYWSYWHQREGEWQYSVVGASAYPVQPGAVEGWSWGPGSVTEAIAPPPLTFEEICAAEPVAADEQPAVVATLPAAASPATTPAAQTTTAASPAPAESGTAGWLYGLFAVIVLGLGATLWLLGRRKEAE